MKTYYSVKIVCNSVDELKQIETLLNKDGITTSTDLSDEPANVRTFRRTEAEPTRTAHLPGGRTVELPISQPLQGAPVANERDSAGLPWDARIHSASKEKSEKTGEYRKRRNVDDLVYHTIVAELRGTVPAAQPLPPPPTIAAVTLPPPTVNPFAQFTQPPPPPPTNPLLAPPGSSSKVMLNFAYFQANLPMVVKDLLDKKLIDQNYIAMKCMQLNMTDLFVAMTDQPKAVSLFNLMCTDNIIGLAQY